MSASVLAALLSALLLLSPGAARAVAHVLAENGVTLPASVARVLEALPTDPARDTARRDDEAVCETLSDTEATPEDEPAPREWVAVFSPAPTVFPISFSAAPHTPAVNGVVSAPRRAAFSRACPRAPPV